jgi:hypothetical protein
LNLRLFTVLFHEMESDQQSLLFYTEVRWLSRGKVFERLFKSKEEVAHLLLDSNPTEFQQLFITNTWIGKLAYMSDIFNL